MIARLRLVQQLGLATANSSRTDPGWIEDVEKALYEAQIAIVELKGLQLPRVNVAALAMRAVGGEG